MKFKAWDSSAVTMSTKNLILSSLEICHELDGSIKEKFKGDCLAQRLAFTLMWPATEGSNLGMF